MLDPETGAITVASSGLRIDASLTRTAFLQSPIGAAALAGVINDPWANYTIGLASGEIGPFPAELTFQFKGERLAWIVVFNTSDEFGAGWDDWSREKELARETAHHAWLAASGLPPGTYPFGEVWCGYNDKDALSTIGIRYGPGGDP